MNSKSLTTKEVARLCRVSDATVKRWEEAGIIRSERTNGGHRRFRAEEIARFQRETGLGMKAVRGDESVFAAVTRRPSKKSHSNCKFFQSIVAGCENETANILINHFLKDQSLVQIFDELICPALHRVGELWCGGELSVTQEHLATRTIFNALFKFRNILPVVENNGKTVICCAPEGDLHELPPYLAQMVFENSGFDVINFGANTPLFSLADEIFHYSPAFICISATVLENIERAAHDYQDFRTRIDKLNVPVILGGGAFAERTIVRRFPSEFYAQSFNRLAEIIKSPS